MKKVYTTGVFDLLHKGHINILTQAKALGDTLVVGIQEDESVKLSKGKLPIMCTEERKDQLLSLPFVDEVIVYSDTNQIPHYADKDIIVQGDDWIHSGERLEMIKYIIDNNKRLVLLPRTEGISSSEIKKRICEK